MGKNFLRSYAGVCLQGLVIALACIIFSALSTSAPAVDPNASAITAVWSYVGALAFNLLVLVGAVKGCDRIVKEIMGAVTEIRSLRSKLPVSVLVLDDPLQKIGVVCPVGCNCKDDVDEFLLCVGQLDAVQGEKDQHYMSADTFVAVHKGMVANQPEPKLCRLSLHRRVQALPTKRLKRCSQRGLQQPIITDACRTAKLLQQLLMEQEGLPLCQLFHLAQYLIRVFVFGHEAF